MREALGGSLLLYLIIPIIVLFIFFIAFIMNYASAYRAANYVVTQIENCQGHTDCLDMEKVTETVRKTYKYIVPNNGIVPVCYIRNSSSKTVNSYVYRVSLPVSFDLPLISSINTITVKAETKTINNVPSNSLTQFSECKK